MIGTRVICTEERESAADCDCEVCEGVEGACETCEGVECARVTFEEVEIGRVICEGGGTCEGVGDCAISEGVDDVTVTLEDV